MSTAVRKRLHVSGLTPAITAADLNARLQGFGKVLALDGVGALNAVVDGAIAGAGSAGEPGKFAYVTLEATENNLARCLNVLSGTTWKGAKLRIGEARLDYAQRLANERKQAAEGKEEPRPKRRRLPRGVHGVHAGDMSVVSLKNHTLHPAWHKTSLAHLIRPMKMRAARPLPAPASRQSLDAKSKKRKKLALAVPTRARVRVIDPRVYGAVHLREHMLEAVVAAQPSQPSQGPAHARSALPSSRASVQSPSEEDGRQGSKATGAAGGDESRVMPDLEEEKARDLELMMTMFGDDERHWGGAESAEDDVTDEPCAVQAEVTPLPEATHAPVAPATPQKARSLKDLFRPHEEEAGFSLMASLGDLDLDPDLDPAFALDAPAPAATPVPNVPTLSAPGPLQAGSGGVTLDPTLPLFFPQPDNPRANDIFSSSRVEGWVFGRTGDADTIRKRWDETKGALTRAWKKRAREAVKSRKRRYGAPEGEDA
ncbi:hypothetical protein JB92DRAFT_3117325 [Gautieria morchelliformis]|nr:hypothetical protein JB92DRAFT_3117325 [Gautieria morchelliformis]